MYKVTFTQGGKRHTIELEAVGVLAAIRDVRAMFPGAQKINVERLQ